jgi:antitoxin HicB
MTDTRRYPAHVFWSEEDAGYIALATDLPGCSAFGETQDAALAELQDAIDAWVEAQRSAGNRIPQPSTPAQEHSGKVLVRMPRSLHASLALNAKIEDVSLNHFIVHLLSSGNERHSANSAARLIIGASGNVALSTDGCAFNPDQWSLTNMVLLGVNDYTDAADRYRGLTIEPHGSFRMSTRIPSAGFASTVRTSKEKMQVERDG